MATATSRKSERMTENIIAAINAAKEQQGISGKELSARSGVSMQYLYGILRGEHSPTLDRLAAICAALGLSLTIADLGKHGATEALSSKV